MTNYRRPGVDPSMGLVFARTWAVAHGSAWVLAEDLMQPPGIFSDIKYFQTIVRAMERVNIFPEKQEYSARALLYRLDPGVVEGLLQHRWQGGEA